jgi:hypothetical protein
MNLGYAVRALSVLSLLMGLAAIAAPIQIADFVGLTVEIGQSSGYGEIGALYGGNFIALGAIGLYAARRGVASGPALLAAIGTIWAAIAGGRLAVMLLRSVGGVTGWVFLVSEIAVAAVFLLAAYTTRDAS